MSEISVGEVLRDPQIRATGMVQEQVHPKAGPIRVLGVAVKLSETPGRVRTAAPLLGEHTDEVLRELGIEESRLEALRANAVIK